MNRIHVTCDGCQRCWTLEVYDCVYLQLDIESRACPYCEASTLRCHRSADPHPPVVRRTPPRPALRPAGAS